MACRWIAPLVVCGALLVGCSSGPESAPAVSSSESAAAAPRAPQTSAAAAPVPTVDAQSFWYSHQYGSTGYFFESPSRKWRCAIVEGFFGGVGAGCESTAGRVMPVKGAPLVPANDVPENLVPPSSIVMKPNAGPEFVKLGQPYLVRYQGPTPILEYGHNLTALGFTCNTQESGISCRNDSTGKGFTFSTDGYTFEYTPVPADFVPAAPVDAEVVLGAPSDQDSVGYGASRPDGISTNSLCGDTITDVSWDSWGGPVAYGSGTWCQNSGSRSRGEPPQRVTLTATDIGECQGKRAYRSLQFDDQPPTSIC